MDNWNTIIIVVLSMVVIVLLLFFPFERRVPSGLPSHYYDLVDSASSKDTTILIFSDDIDLNEDVPYMAVTTLSNYYSDSNKHNYLIIDMNKYKVLYDDETMIEEIFNSSCIVLVIANLEESGSSMRFDFLDSDQQNSDLIFIHNNDKCAKNYPMNVIENDFPDILFLNFAIIDNINYDRVDIE